MWQTVDRFVSLNLLRMRRRDKICTIWRSSPYTEFSDILRNGSFCHHCWSTQFRNQSVVMSGRHLLPWSLVVTAVLSMTSLHQCYARLLRPESDAKRLYDDKLRFSGYNKLIRPVGNTSDTLTVRIGLRLTQIIDVVSWLCSSPCCFFASHCVSLNLAFYPGSVNMYQLQLCWDLQKPLLKVLGTLCNSRWWCNAPLY